MKLHAIRGEKGWTAALRLSAAEINESQNPTKQLKTLNLTLLSADHNFIWNDWKDAGKMMHWSLCFILPLYAVLTKQLSAPLFLIPQHFPWPQYLWTLIMRAVLCLVFTEDGYQSIICGCNIAWQRCKVFISTTQLSPVFYSLKKFTLIMWSR